MGAAAADDTHDEHTPDAEHVHMALAGDADLLDHDSAGEREDGPGSDDADSSRYARPGMASWVGRARVMPGQLCPASRVGRAAGGKLRHTLLCRKLGQKARFLRSRGFFCEGHECPWAPSL